MRQYRHAGFLATLLTVLSLLPFTAAALGFGAISLKSHLNEPLDAELSLMLDSAEAMDQVRVELASAMEYRQMGLYRNPELEQVQVARLEHSSNGAIVRLFTTTPLHAPILSVVLKVSKAGRGTYFRHYRLLFDAVETPSVNKPVVLPLPSTQHPVADSGDDGVEGDGWARVSRYGPVQPGESLGRIATRLRKDDRFNNRQVMLALYDKNLQEFVSGDINNLKQGSWLNVPEGEVVRRYGDEASMLRLSGLLQHTASEAEKPVTAPLAQAQAVPEDQAPLHYSSRISLNGEQPAAKREEVVDKALSAIHEELMGGKLQMTDLGKSVAVLHTSVAEIQGDIRSLKHDVAAINARPQVVVNQTEMSWQVAFYLLLAAVAGGLLGFMLRRHSQSGQASVAPVTAHGTVTAEPVKKTTAMMPAMTHPVADKPAAADAVIQLMNKVEERVGRCDYEEAVRLLDEVDARATGSLKAAALRAQIYHETGHSQECLALINRISESSDKDSWQRFCQLLPAHVWSACFGDEEDGGGGETADDNGRLSL